MSDEHEPASEPMPEGSDQPQPSDILVDRWWDDHFPGTAIARDTASWNIAIAAKERLKQLLRSKI